MSSSVENQTMNTENHQKMRIANDDKKYQDLRSESIYKFFVNVCRFAK